MITLIFFLTFLGVEFFYQTSQKAVFPKSTFVIEWLLGNEFSSRIVGIGLLIIAASFSVLVFGLGAGLFAFIGILILLLSLVVLVSPWYSLKFWWLPLVFVTSLTVELIGYACE